jgi:hypothetical protein
MHELSARTTQRRAHAKQNRSNASKDWVGTVLCPAVGEALRIDRTFAHPPNSSSLLLLSQTLARDQVAK